MDSVDKFDKVIKTCYNTRIIINPRRSMNKPLKFAGLTAVLVVFCALVGVGTANAASAPILYVTKDKAKININEKVTIHALSVVQEQSGTAPESIGFYINGSKTPTVTCNDTHYCGLVYWATKKTQGNKWYKFTVKAKYQNLTTAKNTYVFVTNKDAGKPVPKQETPETPATPATDQAPAFSQIITSNHQPKVSETFMATIYPKEKGYAMLNKIDVFLDGKVVKTCALNNTIAPCGATFGPFVVGDVGEHKYEFLMVDVNGKTNKPWGKFWVNAVNADLTYPQWEKVLTGGNNLKVGDSFSATMYAKNDPKVTKIIGLIDNATTQECLDTAVCTMTKGPYTAAGEHTYSFTLVAENGKSVVATNGKFWIENTTDVTAPSATVKADKTEINYTNDTVTITANATDNKGVSKIWIFVANGLVKECKDSNVCVYTSGGDHYPGATIAYKATAFDAAGNSITTAEQYVKVKPKEATAAISIATDVSGSIGTGQKVVFTAKVDSAGKTIDHLDVIVNQKLVNTCKTVECAYTGGPYPEYANKNVTYGATVYFTDGAKLLTGYQILEVKGDPTLTITPSAVSLTDKDKIDFKVVGNVGAKQFKSIDILVNQKIVETCSVSPNCGYTGGPYPEYAGKSINYAATMFFTDGTYITTGYNWISVTVAVEPKVSAKVYKSYLYDTDLLTVAAAVEPGSKKLSHLNILINQKIAHTCYSTACAFTGGPYPEYAGKSVSYGVTAYFTDGTNKFDGYYYLAVVKADPKISLSSDKTSVADKEIFKLSANLDSGSKQVSSWGIYTGNGGISSGGGLVMYCNGGSTACSAEGLYVLSPTTNFHAEAKFTDGSIYKSNSVTIYLKSANSRIQ